VLLFKNCPDFFTGFSQKMNLDDIEFWTYDQLIANVEQLHSKNEVFTKNLGLEIVNFLNSSAIIDETEHRRNSKAWLSWCREQKGRVKVVDFDIPEGILNSKTKGVLYDMKVSSKGPDDAAYNKYIDLR
jgi:hypothetical protein